MPSYAPRLAQVLAARDKSVTAATDEAGLLDAIKAMLLPSVASDGTPLKAEFRISGFFGKYACRLLTLSS
jgi:hypothetical protein